MVLVSDDTVIATSIRLGPPDLVAAQRAMSWRIWVVLGITSVAVLSASLWLGRADPVYPVFPIFVLVFVAATIWRVIRDDRRRALADATEADWNVAFRFDREGVTIESSNARSQFYWRGIHRYREERDLFLLFTSEAAAQFVPKRALPPDQLDTVRAMLAQRIRTRRRTLAIRIGFVPRRAIRTLVLWILLVGSFLAIWRFLDG